MNRRSLLHSVLLLVSLTSTLAWRPLSSIRPTCVTTPTTRKAVLNGMATGTLGSLIFSPNLARAAAPATPAEAVRRSAANIPGYGPTDVFFPKSWAGQWRVQRLVNFGDKGGSSDNTATLVLDYIVRFIPSIDDDATVADRGFNQANLEAAVSRGMSPSYEWTSTNPNDLRLAWPDSRRKDIKVTQRATDYDRLVDGLLWSSEVQRVTTDGGKADVPTILARRVVTQYRWEISPANTTPSIVQALEVIYSLQTNTAANKEILSKSRIIMQKLDTAAFKQ